MRSVGIVLLCLGTIVATLGGGKLPEIDITMTAIGIFLLLVGSFFYLKGKSLKLKNLPEQNGQNERKKSKRDAAFACLEEVLSDLKDLEGQFHDLSESDLAARLSQNQKKLADFSDRAEEFQMLWGSKKYAQIFSEFASQERFLNRSWSAITDHHRDEALSALRKSIEKLGLTLEKGKKAKFQVRTGC